MSKYSVLNPPTTKDLVAAIPAAIRREPRIALILKDRTMGEWRTRTEAGTFNSIGINSQDVSYLRTLLSLTGSGSVRIGIAQDVHAEPVAFYADEQGIEKLLRGHQLGITGDEVKAAATSVPSQQSQRVVLSQDHRNALVRVNTDMPPVATLGIVLDRYLGVRATAIPATSPDQIVIESLSSLRETSTMVRTTHAMSAHHDALGVFQRLFTAASAEFEGVYGFVFTPAGDVYAAGRTAYDWLLIQSTGPESDTGTTGVVPAPIAVAAAIAKATNSSQSPIVRFTGGVLGLVMFVIATMCVFLLWRLSILPVSVSLADVLGPFAQPLDTGLWPIGVINPSVVLASLFSIIELAWFFVHPMIGNRMLQNRMRNVMLGVFFLDTSLTAMVLHRVVSETWSPAIFIATYGEIHGGIMSVLYIGLIGLLGMSVAIGFEYGVIVCAYLGFMLFPSLWVTISETVNFLSANVVRFFFVVSDAWNSIRTQTQDEQQRRRPNPHVISVSPSSSSLVSWFPIYGVVILVAIGFAIFIKGMFGI